MIKHVSVLMDISADVEKEEQDITELVKSIEVVSHWKGKENSDWAEIVGSSILAWKEIATKLIPDHIIDGIRRFYADEMW